MKRLIAAVTQQEDINFLLTNRIPRAALTRFMGWFSKIENPVIRDLSIGCWRLFCKNERAVILARLATGELLTLVPVAAILVASIRLHFLKRSLNAKTEPHVSVACDTVVRKGEELGWFEHGSTIIVLAPGTLKLFPNIREGARIKVGEPLFFRQAP